MHFLIKETRDVVAIKLTTPRLSCPLDIAIYTENFIHHFDLVGKLEMEKNPEYDDNIFAPKYIIKEDSFSILNSLVKKMNSFDNFRFYTSKDYGVNVYAISCPSKFKNEDLDGYIKDASSAIFKYVDEVDTERERSSYLTAVY